jgi:predicted negative regulator of RcsB-dependent stress response
MDNAASDEQLMRYLDDELPGADKEAFERRLSLEPAVMEELQRLRVAKDAVHLLGIKQQVSAIHRTMMEELPGEKKIVSRPAPIRRIVRYSLAAAAVILLVFVGIKGYQFYSLTADAVFREQYSSFELSSLRGSDSASSSIEKAYRGKNYSEVISLAGKEGSLSTKDNFLSAMAYMETKDYPHAISSFKNVSNGDSNSIFKDAAEYYLALAYIEVKDYNNALPLLLSIKNNINHLYHDKISDHLISEVKMLRWK